MYNQLIKNNNIEDNKYKFLKNMIIEKEKYNNFDEDTKKRYNQILEKGQLALKSSDYELAYDYFCAGKHIFQLPIFDYYIGKTLHKTRRFAEAKKYFKKYIRNGGEKINKCLFFMLVHIIEPNKFVKSYNELFEIDQVMDRDFDLSKKIEPITGCMINEYIYNDSYYESCNLNEKLILIRTLLESHNVKMANKLLKQLKGDTAAEKQLIKQFNKDKKIYVNNYKR